MFERAPVQVLRWAPRGARPGREGLKAGPGAAGAGQAVETRIGVEAGGEHDARRIAQHRHVPGGAGQVAHLGGDAQPLLGPDPPHGGRHDLHLLLRLTAGVPGGRALPRRPAAAGPPQGGAVVRGVRRVATRTVLAAATGWRQSRRRLVTPNSVS